MTAVLRHRLIVAFSFLRRRESLHLIALQRRLLFPQDCVLWQVEDGEGKPLMAFIPDALIPAASDDDDDSSSSSDDDGDGRGGGEE